jgi:lysophospholipase L1-like esterase
VVLIITFLVLLCTLTSFIVHGKPSGKPSGETSGKMTSELLPTMCNASGHCFEAAATPSPRTVYSVRTLEQLRQWPNLVDKNRARALDFAATLKEGGDLKKDAVLFLGDSIFESYLGTSYGGPAERAKSTKEVLERFSAKHNLAPLVLAVSGDQTQHLLWRLQSQGHTQGGGGEFLPSICDLTRATVVLLIGTNNLGAGHLPAEAAQGVLAVVDWILASSCQAKRVVVLALFPRGNSHSNLPHLCPPRCNPTTGAPFKSFLPAIDRVNADVKAGVEARAQRQHGRIGFVDCGQRFRLSPNATAAIHSDGNDQRKEVDLSFFPDELHPNAAGHQLILECLAQSGSLLPSGHDQERR